MDSLTYLLLLALLCKCVSTAGETVIRVDRSDQHVLLECHNDNAAFDFVRGAVWARGGEMVHNSSRMKVNENGTITIAPALPEDEGEYRCGPDKDSLGERFNFTVPPRALKKPRQMFGHLGSNFSIPCLVEIGPISRQQGFTVEWIQRTQQPTGLPLNALIQYEGNASEADTTLIPSSFDSSHIFNVSDLSLLVYDFSVPDVNRKEIYYTCKISAGPQRQQKASAMINVTTQFTPIRIVTPLPGLIVGYPGEVIMQSFVYEGAPIVERSLSLAGENIAKSGKFKFQPERQSDNTTKIFLEIPEPQEDDSGLLNITLTGVNSTDGTESYIIIIPIVSNPKLTCGEPILSFELPQKVRSPGVNLQLQTKVRFTEVPPFGTADSESRVVDATYEIETATTQDCPSDAERCTVEIDLSGQLPNEVAEFDRYRAEALLLVNGIEGHQFSPSTLTVPRVCNTPPQQETLMLAVDFIDGMCSTVASEEISEALQTTIHDRCNFNCDDLAFGTPQLRCSIDNSNGNFTVTVTAIEAKAVVEDFYSATRTEPVLIESDAVNVRIQCLSCVPPATTNDESHFMRYIIIGLVGVIAVLILLVLGLILVVVTKKKNKCRRKNEDPEEPAPAGNIELQQVQPIRIPPDPPQRSQISLTIPANIRSRTEHTHPPPSPNTPGIYVERILSTTPPLQYREATLNVPDPPLSEQRLPSHAAHSCSIDPSSLPTLQLHEVATLTSAQLEGRYSPSSYQGSEASSAYYVYPDNQTPHRSPMPTPPPSPRRATTVSAREVTPHRCECQCGLPLNTVLSAKPIPVSPPCQSLSGNLAHQLQPQTIFQFPCDAASCNRCTGAGYMQTRIVCSSTCQRCRSNPELHAQMPKVEYITAEQLRERAAASSSQILESAPHQLDSQGLSTAVHQSPIAHLKQPHNPLHYPSSTSLHVHVPIDENGYVLKTVDLTSLSERRVAPSAKPGYVYLPRTVPSNVPSNSDALHTVAHSHDRPVSTGYVMCPMHTMPSSSSQPSYRPARPGYVEHVVKKPPAICIPEDVIDGTSSPVEKVPEDEVLRTTLWLVNNGTASDSEGTEESRSIEESTDNTGCVESAC